MSWLDRLMGIPDPQVEPPSDPLGFRPPSDRDMERVDFHIARYERAIEQCVKGPERLAELERGLAYWNAVKTVSEMKVRG